MRPSRVTVSLAYDMKYAGVAIVCQYADGAEVLKGGAYLFWLASSIVALS
jgi:hypothetical protein